MGWFKGELVVSLTGLALTCCAVMSLATEAKADPIHVYAGSHLGTEVALKTTKWIAGESRITPYNRIVSGLVVGILIEASTQDWSDRGAGMLGITTGNLMQINF